MNSLSFVCKLQATLLAVCSRACPRTLAAADLTFYISQRKHVIYRQLSLQPRLVLLSVSKWEGSASQGQPSFPPSPPLPLFPSPPLPSPKYQFHGHLPPFLDCRQLCVYVGAHSVYCTLAKILHTEEKLPFASHMVQVLNMILFTASELYNLRMQLKDLATPVG